VSDAPSHPETDLYRKTRVVPVIFSPLELATIQQSQGDYNNFFLAFSVVFLVACIHAAALTIYKMGAAELSLCGLEPIPTCSDK
jgi:hypothetical protein